MVISRGSSGLRKRRWFRGNEAENAHSRIRFELQVEAESGIAAGQHLSREIQLWKLENDVARVIFRGEIHHSENLALKP